MNRLNKKTQERLGYAIRRSWKGNPSRGDLAVLQGGGYSIWAATRHCQSRSVTWGPVTSEDSRWSRWRDSSYWIQFCTNLEILLLLNSLRKISKCTQLKNNSISLHDPLSDLSQACIDINMWWIRWPIFPDFSSRCNPECSKTRLLSHNRITTKINRDLLALISP